MRHAATAMFVAFVAGFVTSAATVRNQFAPEDTTRPVTQTASPVNQPSTWPSARHVHAAMGNLNRASKEIDAAYLSLQDAQAAGNKP